MLRPPAPFHLRTLRVTDLEAMQPIERASFPTPTSERTYRYELTQNRLAHYQAVTVQQGAREALLGYAGFWFVAGEVHVSIIAVAPAWRGRGLGELLLLNQIRLALARQAELVTLEVRESNATAQALYRKYDFEVVGRRRRYYKDTGEDALLMTLPLQDSETVLSALQRRQEALFARLAGEALPPDPVYNQEEHSD